MSRFELVTLNLVLGVGFCIYVWNNYSSAWSILITILVILGFVVGWATDMAKTESKKTIADSVQRDTSVMTKEKKSPGFLLIFAIISSSVLFTFWILVLIGQDPSSPYRSTREGYLTTMSLIFLGPIALIWIFVLFRNEFVSKKKEIKRNDNIIPIRKAAESQEVIKLRELKMLYEEGAITKTEYEEAKKKVLERY